MLTLSFHVSLMLAAPSSDRKLEQVNLRASWKLSSSSSSSPQIHLIRFFVSLSVSLSKSLHSAAIFLFVVAGASWC